jgi:hypothetical protein
MVQSHIQGAAILATRANGEKSACSGLKGGGTGAQRTHLNFLARTASRSAIKDMEAPGAHVRHHQRRALGMERQRTETLPHRPVQFPASEHAVPRVDLVGLALSLLGLPELFTAFMGPQIAKERAGWDAIKGAGRRGSQQERRCQEAAGDQRGAATGGRSARFHQTITLTTDRQGIPGADRAVFQVHRNTRTSNGGCGKDSRTRRLHTPILPPPRFVIATIEGFGGTPSLKSGQRVETLVKLAGLAFGSSSSGSPGC